MAILDSVSDLGARALSPTDVTTFIRLEQCERYLRLRLHERRDGLGFMKDFGVVPQTITPLLQLSGSRFEAELETTSSATIEYSIAPAMAFRRATAKATTRCCCKPPSNCRAAKP